MNERRIFYLAGMPRSGSTLLLNILKQNDDLHIEGTSALVEFMWSAFDAGSINMLDLLVANDRFPHTTRDIVASIPETFYKYTDKKYIIDKNRKWCSAANVAMIKECFDPDPKVIVLTRKTSEVVASYVNLLRKNNKPQSAVDNFLDLHQNKLILDAVNSVVDARTYFEDDFLFVDYSELIEAPEEQVAKIYSYLGIPSFSHNFSEITDYCLENDATYGLDGLHSIRPQIARQEHDVVLNDNVLQVCYTFDQRMQPKQQGVR